MSKQNVGPTPGLALSEAIELLPDELLRARRGVRDRGSSCQWSR